MKLNTVRHDRKGREWVVLSGALTLSLFLCFGIARGADNSACLGCHQDESMSKQDATGKKVSLFVSEAEYKDSIHGRLSCSSCHTQIKDDAHAAGSSKVSDHKVNCGACHREPEKGYQQGLHAKMIKKGTERPAYCSDCHGKHHVLPSKNPKSMTHPDNIAKTCNRCHSDVEFVKLHALGTGPSPENFLRRASTGSQER